MFVVAFNGQNILQHLFEDGKFLGDKIDFQVLSTDGLELEIHIPLNHILCFKQWNQLERPTWNEVP